MKIKDISDVSKIEHFCKNGKKCWKIYCSDKRGSNFNFTTKVRKIAEIASTKFGVQWTSIRKVVIL